MPWLVIKQKKKKEKNRRQKKKIYSFVSIIVLRKKHITTTKSNVEGMIFLFYNSYKVIITKQLKINTAPLL